MCKRTRIAAAMALMLLVVGCIDLEQEYTLNPDGSGKVVVHWMGTPFGKEAPDALVKRLLNDEITKAEGVEGWKGVSCAVRDDGKVEFKGTAYFKDFSKLKLHNSGTSTIPFRISKDKAGNLVVLIEPEGTKASNQPVSDEEARKGLRELRSEHQETKPMWDLMMANLKISVRFNVPARVGSVSNFKKVSDKSIQLTVEGEKFRKVVDDLIMDDDLMFKLAKEGAGFQGAALGVVAEKLFGEKGPVRAVTAGVQKPQFNYQAELVQARKDHEALLRKLAASSPPPPAAPVEQSSLVPAAQAAQQPPTPAAQHPASPPRSSDDFGAVVAIDNGGNLYLVDAEHGTIRRIAPNGEVTMFARGSNGGNGVGAFESLSGLATDSRGNVYVAVPNHTILKITPVGVVAALAGSADNPGQEDGTGSAARFYDPVGLATDSRGNVYVADTGNHTIRKITPSGVVTTLAGSPGQKGTEDGTGSAARFRNPRGVATNRDGNIYVADTGNNAIRKITQSGVVTTLAGVAEWGFGGSADGTGSAARFHFPYGIATDRTGNVYVADTKNHTIRKISPSGVVTTLAGAAEQEGNADGAGSSARFNNPLGVAVDSSGNVYVADAGNRAIRKITPAGAVSAFRAAPEKSANHE